VYCLGRPGTICAEIPATHDDDEEEEEAILKPRIIQYYPYPLEISRGELMES
jgi:hypothetical protein